MSAASARAMNGLGPLTTPKLACRMIYEDRTCLNRCWFRAGKCPKCQELSQKPCIHTPTANVSSGSSSTHITLLLLLHLVPFISPPFQIVLRTWPLTGPVRCRGLLEVLHSLRRVLHLVLTILLVLGQIVGRDRLRCRAVTT